MRQIPDHIELLIARVITGEADAGDRSALSTWLDEDSSNQVLFDRLVPVIKRPVSETPVFDVDRAWQAVHRRIQEPVAATPAARPTRTLRLFFRVAAAAVVLFAVGYMALWFSGGPASTLASGDAVRTDTLSAGIRMTMNKQAEAEVTARRGGKEIRVELRGEAFFESGEEHTAELVVETGDLLIRDIGTRFNVAAREGEDSVRVYVSEGIVELTSKKNDAQSLVLTAGQDGGYVRSTGAFFRIERSEEVPSAYADRDFRFTNAPLKKVIRRLNEVYDIPIRLDSEQLGSCRITVRFENEDIGMIADVIAETLGLTAVHEEEQIVLYGEGCE